VLQLSKWFAFLWVLLAGACCGAPAAGASDDATTTAAIASLLRTSAGYWNRGRLDDFMQSYENSPATTYVSSKSVIRGFKAIRAHYASSYRGGHVGTLSMTNVAVRPLGTTYAVVVARWRLALHDGTRPSGIFSLVLHRGAAGWRIITDHSP